VYEAIVVGTDGSETAAEAVSEAFSLAEALKSKVHVVSAYEPLRGARIVGAPEEAAKVWQIRPDSEVQSIVDEATSLARRRGVDVKAHTLVGDPADALLKVAEEENADVIVVGSRGMHGVGRVLGSVPNKVSHRAGCHVLIVATESG